MTPPETMTSGSLEVGSDSPAYRGMKFQAIAKRALDVSGALVLLVLLVPTLVVVASLVRLSSPGPILFRQQRVGRKGRLFWFYKFRTMRHGSDAAPHKEFYARLIRREVDPTSQMFKLTHDVRVTPIGRVLRRFSLDEVPQVFNVLKGDMSLVGPRPPIPYEVEMYGPRELTRLSVTPGLTGLWQVSGRGAVAFERMIELDLEYIATWSLGLDVFILLRTPWAIITGRGAT